MVHVEPDDAFGQYDADLVKVEPRNRLPTPLEVGMQFEGSPDGGEDEESLIFTVTDIADDKVVLDGNHPLAGMALRFALNVAQVRSATEEEMEKKNVDGGQGHHHDDSEDGDEGDHFRSHPLH